MSDYLTHFLFQIGHFILNDLMFQVMIQNSHPRLHKTLPY